MHILIGLGLAFVIVAMFARRRASRDCRWREYKTGDFSTWRCAFCGAEMMGEKDQMPRLCFRTSKTEA